MTSSFGRLGTEMEKEGLFFIQILTCWGGMRGGKLLSTAGKTHVVTKLQSCRFTRGDNDPDSHYQRPSCTGCPHRRAFAGTVRFVVVYTYLPQLFSVFVYIFNIHDFSADGDIIFPTALVRYTPSRDSSRRADWYGKLNQRESKQ